MLSDVVSYSNSTCVSRHVMAAVWWTACTPASLIDHAMMAI